MDQHRVPLNERFSHYDFRRAVARAWMDPEGEARVKAWKASRVASSLVANITPRQEQVRESRSASAQQKRNPFDDTTARSSNSIDSPKQSKSPPISDTSLAPTGKLKCRLDYFECKHLPISAEKAGKPLAKCGLHRWALGREGEVRKSILVCGDCNVSLCVDCFRVFHTVADLSSLKEELKNKLILDNDAKQTPKKAPPKGNKRARTPVNSVTSASKRRK